VLREALAARAAFANEFFDKSAARRREIARDVIRGQLPLEQVQLDLVTLLYLNWDEGWPEDLPLQEATTYVVGAAATTAHALPQLVMHLESWLQRHPEDRHLVTEQDDFLRRAAAESLRFFVAAPARIRVATQDVVLRCTGRAISAGARVALYFRPANRDPKLFGEDADEFNPHRAAAGVPWGLAFGLGSHACPGRPVVVGYGNPDEYEGTLVTIVRALWDRGLELDPDRPPVRDAGTHYDAYSSVPIRLRWL
jgi:cytochrome P450